jgi:uncharacterized membrane protein
MTPALFGRDAERAIFRASLLFKGLFAVLEIGAGALAYFVSAGEIVRVVASITQDELSEDPNDFVASHLLAAAEKLSIGGQRFAAFYLLSHGIVKTFLIVGLLRERLWYYPVSIAAFAGFAAYQMLRFTRTHSVWLLVLTIVDAIVIVLAWREYRMLRADARAR